MEELLSDSQQIIKDYLDSNQAKLFGDQIIGYRAQLQNGEFDDEGFGEIYESLGGIENGLLFNADCEKLKSGEHNW